MIKKISLYKFHHFISLTILLSLIHAGENDDRRGSISVEKSGSSSQTGVALLVPLHVGRDNLHDDNLDGDQQEEHHERRHVVFLLSRDDPFTLQQ